MQVLSEKLTTWTTDEALTLELNPDINCTTVFGLLLGYPVVYWYSNTASADNCLSCAPLRVYRISATDNTADGQPAVIYSFTVPEQLFSEYQLLIDNWQKQLFTLASRYWDSYSLHVDCEVIIQPVVCM